MSEPTIIHICDASQTSRRPATRYNRNLIRYQARLANGR